MKFEIEFYRSSNENTNQTVITLQTPGCTYTLDCNDPDPYKTTSLVCTKPRNNICRINPNSTDNK